MVSTATAASAAAQRKQKRKSTAKKTQKKAPPPVQGFDTMAAFLTDTFDALGSNNKTTANGIILTARKLLKTSFTSSIKGVGKSIASVTTTITQTQQSQDEAERTPGAVITTPSTAASSTRSTRSSASLFTPLTPVPLASSILLDDDSAVHDFPHIQLSTINRGMRRLKYPAFLRMREGEEFILVLPHRDRKLPNIVKAQREHVIQSFRKIIVQGGIGGTSAEKQDIWDSELSRRVFQREGKDHYEFHVKIASYPERENLTIENLDPNYVRNLIVKKDGNKGGGIYLGLYGYGNAVQVLLRFESLPYVELHVPRKPNEPFLSDTIQLPSTTDDVKLAEALTTELHAAKGDACAYVEIMMKYYKHRYDRLKAVARSASGSDDKIDVDGLIRGTLVDELNSDALTAFASMVDEDYLNRFVETASGWTPATPYLISHSQNRHYYRELRARFPYCHHVLATAVSSRHFPVNKWSTDDESDEEVSEESESEELHRKERMVLFAFYALLRTKSRMLMKNWAQIEPMGLYFKGNQQPGTGRKSFSGAFVSTLTTTFKHQQNIYKVGVDTFNAKLRAEYRGSAAFDNHNKILSKLTQTGGKSAISQVVTAYLLKRDRPFELLFGTKMKSPSGVQFEVISCTEAGDYKYLVKGRITSEEQAQRSPIADMRNDCALIKNGMPWPTLGWVVEWMPGFTPRAPLTFQYQSVPPPMRAWVSPHATNVEIVFDKCRHIEHPLSSTKVSLTSSRYKTLIQMSRRISDLDSHAKYLHYKQDQAKKANKNYDENDMTLRERPQLIQYDLKTVAFINAIDNAFGDIASAVRLQKDMVKHINPKAGEVDSMYVWPIAPYEETSHEGMKKTYAVIGEAFQLFEVDENGRSKLLPGATERIINLCVDALSARNWRHLKYNLIRKLAEMGSAEYVLAMIDALESFTCEHDYFHETSLHRNDCIGKILMKTNVMAKLSTV